MTVNTNKTQLLCVSSAIDSKVSSYIRPNDGSKVVTMDKMKILGFYFGPKPNVDAHIMELQRKVRQRGWIIRNLKRAGLPQNDLLKCYYSLIRPVLDYCCQVYHPMLNGQQTENSKSYKGTYIRPFSLLINHTTKY